MSKFLNVAVALLIAIAAFPNLLTAQEIPGPAQQ